MKKYFYSVCLCIFSLFFIQGFAAVDAKQLGNKQNKAVDYLFVQAGESGQLEFQPNKNSYQIKLNQIDPMVTFFSNVPHRISGFMSLSKFTEIFNHNITAKYPKGLNAAIVYFSDQKKQNRKHFIISLKNPNYDAKNDILTYNATLVPGEQLHLISNQIQMYHPILFIDGICVSCAGDDF